MRVVSVATSPVELRLESAMTLVGGITSAVRNVVVSATTADGVTGFGEATPRPKLNGETVRSVVTIIEDHLGPSLANQEIGGLPAVEAIVQAYPGNYVAKAALEAAILDALGKTLGVSCHALLGGYTDSVPVAALLPLQPAEALVDLVAEHRAVRGVNVFKLKVGKDVDQDLATLSTLRGAYADIEIYADANGSYATRDAVRFMQAAESSGLSMFEEPVGAGDPVGRQLVAECATLPIIGDETCSSVSDAEGQLDLGAVTGVSLKLGRTGLTGSGLLRASAERRGVPVVMGYEHVSSLGAAASFAFAASAAGTSRRASEVLSFLAFERDLVTTPLQVSEGRVRVPTGPGFGVDVELERLPPR